MPVDAEILCLQAQHDQLCLWALVSPDAPTQEVWFLVTGTGFELQDECLRYVGTAQVCGGAFVWHVFRIVA